MIRECRRLQQTVNSSDLANNPDVKRMLVGARAVAEMRGLMHGFEAGKRAGLRRGLLAGVTAGAAIVAFAIWLGAARGGL